MKGVPARECKSLFGKNRDALQQYLKKEVLLRDVTIAVKGKEEVFRGQNHTRYYGIGIEYIQTSTKDAQSKGMLLSELKKQKVNKEVEI